MPKFSKDLLVSVIIPTLNEEVNIGNLIKQFLNQSYKNMEILVVDGGSKDRTLELINSFSLNYIKIFVETDAPPAKARNLGAEKASGGVVLFLDADTAGINTFFLENAMKHFEDPNVVGVHPKGFITADTLVERARYDSSAPSVPINMAPHFIRRDIFIQLGGFEDIGFGEDVLFGRKFTEMLRTTTNRVVFEPGSEITIHDPHTIKEFWRQQKWYGRTFPLYAAKAGLNPQAWVNFYLNSLLSCSVFFILFIPRFPILTINLMPIIFCFAFYLFTGIKESSLKLSLVRFSLIVFGGFAKGLGLMEYLIGNRRMGR